MRCLPLLILAALTLPSAALTIDYSRPQPLPIERQVPTAQDIAYPGTISLTVDATDVARGIFRVK